MKRPIENNSREGEYVYDPFVGSGTTIIAAEMTKRKCLAIEINPTYVDMCVVRWQNFTGKEATLEGSGELFNEVLSKRKKKGATLAAPSKTSRRKLDQLAK